MSGSYNAGSAPIRVVQVDPTTLDDIAGGAGASGAVTLLSNASATGSATSAMAGGTYLWQYQGTFSGATLTLQSLGPDGSTYQDVASVTSAGQQAVLVGQGDILRVSISGGPPSGIYSVVRRVS